MDLPSSTEDWEHQVSAFLPDMNSCEEEFFTPQELLVGGGGQTTTTAASAQSPISGANAPSLSPSGGSATGAPTGALSPGAMSQTSNAPATGSCCENGRPIMTDPVSGQTVCSCQYDSARLALSGYSRIPTAGVGVYGTPYPSTDQNPYPSIGVDSSAFYSPLSNPYGLKESGPTTDMSAWTSAGLQPTTGYYPYDPTLAAYGYGAGYDLAARRKNATRESTATLKAWLNEHKKNPYPTKGEKIMLAIITKMTLTQVSTWFANARRRLKKENKMTWEPKNKTDDDDDAMVSDDEKDKDDMDADKNRDHKDPLHHVKSEHDKDDDDDDLTDDDRKPETLGLMTGHGHSMSHHPHSHHPAYQHHQHHSMLGGYPGIKEEISGGPKNQTSSDCGVPIPATKPKIWSLADTAACKTPPPSVAGHHHHLLGHHHQSQQQQQQHQLHQLQQASLHHNNNNNNQAQHQGWMGNYPQSHQQQQQIHQQQHNTNNHSNNGGNGTTVGMMNMSGHMNMGAANNNNANATNNNLSGGGYNGESSPSSNGSYVGNFTRIQDQQLLDSPHQDSSVAAFKPFFKSQQISNGFVSPV
ncbi:unnamed protein product [Hermetia illucens]|uniref:Homeobox domain-containing protein n=1 Tax=Hermetia illucens TaxID=343691 RepID=A0A7R8ULI2_HERIL|nr:unnamed protein product [Hermetia illucens]